MDALWKVHTASVQTFTGATDTGDGYAAAVNVVGFFDDGLMLNQSATDSGHGDVVEGASVFFVDLADQSKFVPESRVTIGGRSMQVIVVKAREGGGVFDPVEHVEVHLR